jgi:lon-related putative ATP-dependent protease
MPAVSPLPAEALCTRCRAEDLGIAASGGPIDGAGFVHRRATDALQLGLEMRHRGYNLFVLGEPGSGRHALVRNLVEKQRHQGTPPTDWCYVNNFADGIRPRLLRLPAGRGAKLRDDLQHFVAELGPAIMAAFESDDYRGRVESLQEQAKQKEDTALRALGHDSAEAGVALLRTPQGFMFAPMKSEEETLSREEFEQLPEEKQQSLGKSVEEFHERLHKLISQFPRWRRDLQSSIKELSREAMRLAVGHLIEELRPGYADLPEVGDFLEQVQADVIETGESLRESSKSEAEAENLLYSGSISVQRYLANLVVDNASLEGRPMICEDHPTLQNLVGRIEHNVHMGTLVSNFTLIRAGALHRANGGFLILDAARLLTQPYAWEGLKRALGNGEIRIESLTDLLGVTSTVQLQPEPVPLDVKVVLVGEPLVYYLLESLDPDFPALFKMAADFDSEVPRNPENAAGYARLIATLADREGLRGFAAPAVARIIDQAARLAEDAERLSTQIRPLADLMREADHLAGAGGSPSVELNHVEAALAARRGRHDRLCRRYQEEILRDRLLIATGGLHVGQINGLAVVSLGEGSFGHPVRITATVRLGEGEVIDIEREVELGGPIHSKGVLILSAFLAGRFGWNMPLSLKASLVFEQSYGGVEGDSASLAELCALISALSGAPIRQSLAVTGSVNQFGVVQPVGGVNEKIEGFFDICKARGLSGDQGVLIPAANRRNLMLRDEVVEAARQGLFRIWAVASVDEAIELLTGLPAGEPDAKGEIPPGSVNYLVITQLAELALTRQSYIGQKIGHRRRRKAPRARQPTKPPAPPEKGDKG